MATRSELLDTRDWYPGAGRGLIEAPAATPSAVHDVIFVDLAGARYGAPRPARLDCLPLIWTRLDSVYDPDAKPGEVQYAITRRTWVREYGDAGVVYREQAPTRFQPTAYQAGKPPKTPKRRVQPDVEPAEEDWVS